MSRTVVVLSRKGAWKPWQSRQHWERVTTALAAKYRPLPDTGERLGADHMELAFPRRHDLGEARAKVAAWLDEIDPDWREHISMTMGE